MIFQTLRTDRRFLIPVLVWSLIIGLSPQSDAGMVGSLDVTSVKHARKSKLARAQRVLSNTQVRERLLAVGLVPAEVDQRIAQLSDDELTRLVEKLDVIQAGKGLEIIAAAVAVFVLIFIFSVLVVDRADDVERDMIDLRTKKPIKRIHTPSSTSPSSTYKSKGGYGY